MLHCRRCESSGGAEPALAGDLDLALRPDLHAVALEYVATSPRTGLLSRCDGHFVIALLAGCHAAPQPVLDRPPEFHRGMSLGLFAPDGAVDYESKLVEIRALGATDVSLVITWVQDDVRASEVRADDGYTATAPLVRRLARRAHQLGMRVMLFPILRLVHRTATEWRGAIHPGDLDRWFATYGALLDELARLAEEEGVERLSIGSELASTERRTDEWERLIARVRHLYRGQLVYRANWNHYPKVPFWSSVDVVGISAYSSVASPGARPSVARAVAAWRPLREKLAAFPKRVGRPLVLTEIGYQSPASCCCSTTRSPRRCKSA